MRTQNNKGEKKPSTIEIGETNKKRGEHQVEKV